MSPGGRVQQFVRNVPPALKKALIADAENRESNITDVALDILATRYGVPVELSHRKATVLPGGSTAINLVMPEVLQFALGIAAVQARHTVPREILTTLCAHYGVRLPRPARPRRRVAA